MTSQGIKKFTNCSIIGILAIFGGCQLSNPQTADGRGQAPQQKIEFLAFGDSGYHINYPNKKDLKNPKKTKEAYYKAYRESLRKKGYSADTPVSLPNLVFQPNIGGYLPTSGLTPIANAMKRYCRQESCDFAVMLGDNIYPVGATLGADRKDDKQRLKALFSDPFGDLGQSVENFSIYVALGNHDWGTSREGAMAQVAFLESTKPFYMDGIFYSVKPPGSKREVELFIIDTTVMLAGTEVYRAKLDQQGQEVPETRKVKPDAWVRPHGDAEKKMVQWLDNGLKSSSARWKFVIAHHPLWSVAGGKFAQGRALRRLILPSLCRYADAFFAGHEHTLELHEDNCETVFGKAAEIPLPQIVSGAASKQREVNLKFKSYQETHYSQLNTIWATGMTWGFSHITLEGDKMQVRMISTPNSGNGEPVPESSHTFKHRSIRVRQDWEEAA